MKSIPKLLILLGIIAIIVGIVVKLIGIDFSSAFVLYPFKPQSFMNFANSLFLLSIAISVLKE
ncbi:MAG: hypothetical protein AB1656_23890 [Candidatus Omnitrophota bacterium]